MQELSTVINKFKDKHTIPDIVVVVIMNGHKEYYFGNSDELNNNLITKESLFEIGSLSKLFTADLLDNILKEKGLSKEDNLGFLFPDYQNLQEITFNDLINHTSGLPRLPENLKPDDMSNPYKDYSNDDLVDFLNNFDKQLTSKTSFEYSNLGYAFIGYIIEMITKNEFHDLLKKYIFDSLEIGFHFNGDKRMVAGHDKNGKQVTFWDQKVFYPAGGIILSITEVGNYLEYRVNERNEIGCMVSNNFYWHNGMTGGFSSFLGFDNQESFGVAILSNKSIPVDPLASEIFKILKNR